jgi:hypothetical protein
MICATATMLVGRRQGQRRPPLAPWSCALVGVAGPPRQRPQVSRRQPASGPRQPELPIIPNALALGGAAICLEGGVAIGWPAHGRAHREGGHGDRELSRASPAHEKVTAITMPSSPRWRHSASSCSPFLNGSEWST